MREILSGIGGRRFFLAVGAGVVTTVLCWFGKIDATTYQWVILGIVTAYITGNTAQKVKGPND